MKFGYLLRAAPAAALKVRGERKLLSDALTQFEVADRCGYMATSSASCPAWKRPGPSADPGLFLSVSRHLRQERIRQSPCEGHFLLAQFADSVTRSASTKLAVVARALTFIARPQAANELE